MSKTTNSDAIVARLKKHSTEQLEYKLKEKLFNNDTEVEIAKEIIAERKAKAAGKEVPKKAVSEKVEKSEVTASKAAPKKKAPVLEGFNAPENGNKNDKPQVGETAGKKGEKVKKEKAAKKSDDGSPKKGDKAKIIVEMMGKGKSAEDIAKVIEEKGLSTLTGAKLLQNIKGNIQYHKNKIEASKKG